ncbi:MAG: S8 family serine peptidase [Chloroflexi bacterium]|nr:S8 family serine peptidase [Chloroflexota bacterium]
MDKVAGLFLFLILFGGLIVGRQKATSASLNTAVAAPWTQKVDAWVLETAAAQGETEFLVYLAEQADLSGAAALPTKLAKGEYVVEQLTAVAQRTQPTVIAALQTANAEFRPYWIANMIWARGDTAVLQTMAQRADVARIYANPTVKLAEPAVVDKTASPTAVNGIEWNISRVNAPDVWAAGYTGQGVVIGGQDTGYDWDHPGLINQYRGWDGATADHNYNWHDAIHSGGGSCGADSAEPCDDGEHGTHTMGTMVGNDLPAADPDWPAGAAHAVGMAPGARWIGCRNMNVGWGTPTTYAECYQWFIAPTDLSGQNPDPAQAPHVINNSWACVESEGCNATNPDVLLAVVQAVRAAGIVTVHSAGNNGSSCSSIRYPAAIYDESFTVGNTTSSDAIASSSSRGPVTVDGSARLKPDIAAPGTSIRSTIPNNNYGNKSGTSMAGPHVAGLVALLISANPSLAGNVELIEATIRQTAVPLTTTQGCGGDGETAVPNNVYGWGRIDAHSAIFSRILQLRNTVSSAVVAPGETLTYTLAVTHSHLDSATHHVVLTDTIPTHTYFITATQPFMQDGDLITWETAFLNPGDTWTVSLATQVLPTASGTIENALYGVRSDEVTTITDSVVQTSVVTQNYLPIVYAQRNYSTENHSDKTR